MSDYYGPCNAGRRPEFFAAGCDADATKYVRVTISGREFTGEHNMRLCDGHALEAESLPGFEFARPFSERALTYARPRRLW